MLSTRTILLVLVLSVIATSSSLGGPTVKVVKYKDTAFAPTTSVEVIRTKAPERPYQEIAELSVRVRGRDDQPELEALVAKAKELGANAIILLGSEQRGAVGVPAGSIVVVKPKNYMKAVAIRFADANTEQPDK